MISRAVPSLALLSLLIAVMPLSAQQNAIDRHAWVSAGMRPHASSIFALLEGYETEHGRRDAFLLAMALSKWEALPLRIVGAADGDEKIWTLARSALHRWLDEQNRTFAYPTRQQLQLIGAALESHRLALQRSGVAELRSILRFWNS
jgi:hypothetical protein